MKFRLITLVATALVLSTTLFTSCDKDEDPIDVIDNSNDPVVEEPDIDGFYVYGSGSAAADVQSPSAKMEPAALEANRSNGREFIQGIYGKFMYLDANAALEFTFIESGEPTVYGAGTDAKVDSGTVFGGAFEDLALGGSLVVGGNALTTAEAGLYYLYVDFNAENFISYFILMGNMFRVFPFVISSDLLSFVLGD